MPCTNIAAAMIGAFISRMANALQWAQLLCTSVRWLNQIAISNRVPLSVSEMVEWCLLKKFLEQRTLNFGSIAYNVHNSDNPLI